MSEVAEIPQDVARAIRLVILDVDGVMTDGGIYLGADEKGATFELKRFEITDGMGVHLLRRAGLELAIVTGRRSEAVALRARELGIREVHQDPGADKLPIVQSLLKRLGLEWGQAAFLSDDLADIPVLRRVGLPVAVANAAPEVREIASWRTGRRGGEGAVREFSEALLRARGDWDAVLEGYLREREEGSNGSG